MQMEIMNRIIVQQGEPETIIKRLKDYILPIDAKWLQRIKAASEESMKKLKKILRMEEIGLEFPEVFIQLAKFAGESDGGLFEETSTSLSITDLINRNEELYDSKNGALNPYYFSFLHDQLEFEYIIDLRDGKNQAVYFSEYWKVIDEFDIVSECFEKFLCQCATKLYEYSYFPYSVGFDTTVRSLHESFLGKSKVDPFEYLRILSDKYKLQKAWFSDKCFYFAYSSDLSLVITKKIFSNANDISIYGVLASNNKELLEQLEEDFLIKIGATIYRDK
ncbi:MAG: hypothetical protein FWC47_15890 [Oscillospiraceae bacterium]|nr:hypothetical protein [Oscillospiraceae bacterium]